MAASRIDRIVKGIPCKREPAFERFIPDAKERVVAAVVAKHPSAILADDLFNQLARDGNVEGAIWWAIADLLREGFLAESPNAWGGQLYESKIKITPVDPNSPIRWSNWKVSATEKLLSLPSWQLVEGAPPTKGRGRPTNKERDELILADVDSGLYTQDELAEKWNYEDHTGVSKAAKRAREAKSVK